MELRVLQKEKDTMKVEVKGESQGFTQLVAKEIWKQGSEAAAVKEHPAVEEPKIIVKASNPKKALEKAASKIEDLCEDFKKEFSSALKK